MTRRSEQWTGLSPFAFVQGDPAEVEDDRDISPTRETSSAHEPREEAAEGTVEETPVRPAQRTSRHRPPLLRRLTSRESFEDADGEAEESFAYESGAARVTLHRDVAAACAQAASLNEALAFAVERLCRVNRWPVGHAFVRLDDGWPGLVSADIWHLSDPERFADFRQATEQTFGDLAAAETADGLAHEYADVCGPGLVDRATARRGLVCLEDLDSHVDLPRAAVAEKAGLRAGVAIPVLADGEVIAALEFFLAQPGSPSPAQRDLLEFVAGQLGHLASRERTREAVRFAAQRSRTLVGQLKDTVTQLRESEERYSLVFQSANDGLWDWDLRTDAIYYSERWKTMLGCQDEEVTDSPDEWMGRVHPDDLEQLEVSLRQHLDGEHGRFECEHRIAHRDGEYRWVLARGLAVHDAAGEPYRLSGSLTDITDRKRQEELSLKDVLYDPRTGLPTHAILLDRLDQALRRKTRRPDQSSAVLSVSIHGMEAATELGITAVEETYHTLVRRFLAAVRPGDTIAHSETDEFAVVLEEINDLESAHRIAGRIQANIGLPFNVGDATFNLAAHIGIAICLPSHDGPEGLLRDARAAMLRAIASDGQIEVTDPERPGYGDSLAELESDLARAVENDELSLEYLPTVSLHDGRLTGLEALVRWNHPEHGVIPPGRFIPLAEESNLINQIGYWVITRACDQLKLWRDKFSTSRDVTVAVNLSHRQLFDPDLLRRIRESLEESALNGKWLRMDVTESALARDPRTAQSVLNNLQKLGIKVAIDDFGAGFSSLAFLHRFPVNALKIDRSFVSGGQGKSEQWEIARTIVELGRMLNIEVIAEGIETKEQFSRLRSLGCKEAQGFFFSGPVSPEEAARLIYDGYPLDLTAPLR